MRVFVCTYDIDYEMSQEVPFLPPINLAKALILNSDYVHLTKAGFLDDVIIPFSWIYIVYVAPALEFRIHG